LALAVKSNLAVMLSCAALYGLHVSC